MWDDLKYLIAYLSPMAAAVGLYLGGIWSPGAVYIGFMVIPLLELVLPARKDNVPIREETHRNTMKHFDWLLYFHLPIVYGLVVYFVYRVGFTKLHIWELIGMTMNMGVILGSYGINVAHELGHRADKVSAWIARLLLVPSLYTHFTIEHNYGHHRHVGTYEDPATARLGESIYAFWWRSVIGSFLNAWRLERERLLRSGKAFIGLSNQLILGVGLQLLYLIVIVIWAGWIALLVVLLAAMMGFLLLETVNYIEHYGLVRKKLPSGHYETVGAIHSWNSNHELGRIFLYELTRHADHHYRTSRHYQILRHLEGAPQLPAGYPGSMMLSLVPGMWRRVMDKRIKVKM
ncbi:MAG TPA: alkane 1-monooxygenase [Saprospiraceae bacterium]|nr:alkane 1-monooxygenase [Saprospiraceae bacterium]